MSDLLNNHSITGKREKFLFDGDIKVAVNTIQRTLFVERLYVNVAYPADRIIPYDIDNLYPNKIKSIAQRSGTTKSAIKKLSEFIIGEGVQGNEIIVNKEGNTIWDILKFCSKQKALFDGYVLHFNYNLLGQITEINTVNFEFARWSKNLDKIVINPDWARRYRRRKEEEEYYPFNPKNVIKEINECGGIENYKGQILYSIPNIEDYYCVCNWDSVLDDAQLEAEVKLYSLSNIQNDYSLSGIIAIPTNLVDKKDVDEIKEELQKDKGSANAGGVRVVSVLPTENLANWKFFTPTSRSNIDALHTNQIERAKYNIYAAFNQPPILSGISPQGMFNEASFADAFNYYNSATETDRKELEKELKKVLQSSIWASSFQAFEILPKKYVTREHNEC